MSLILLNPLERMHAYKKTLSVFLKKIIVSVKILHIAIIFSVSKLSNNFNVDLFRFL